MDSLLFLFFVATMLTDVPEKSTFKSMDRTLHQSVESFMASSNSKSMSFTASEAIDFTTSKTMGLSTFEAMSLTVSEKQMMISSSLPKSHCMFSITFCVLQLF